MRRRTFLSAALLIAASSAVARAQIDLATPPEAGQIPSDAIRPTNELERVLVAATYTDPSLRPTFPRVLLRSQVVLALESDAADAAPMMETLSDGQRYAVIYTSADRLSTALGPAVAHTAISGRAALTRLRVRNVALNFKLAPMVTLAPDDIARYLALPADTGGSH